MSKELATTTRWITIVSGLGILCKERNEDACRDFSTNSATHLQIEEDITTGKLQGIIHAACDTCFSRLQVKEEIRLSAQLAEDGAKE